METNRKASSPSLVSLLLYKSTKLCYRRRHAMSRACSSETLNHSSISFVGTRLYLKLRR